jgi:predicted NUDIX family phosphoesterase
MAETGSESVLVVPTDLFRKIGYFQGFSDDPGRYLQELLQPANLSFQPRDAAEFDPRLKQLIPYVILRSGSDTGKECLFQYTRGKLQGEQRLHSKKSIGIGGHISKSDVREGIGPDTYERGMTREISEEVDIQSSFVQQCVGLINDDSNDVGRVHLGVVHIFDLREPLATARDTEMWNSGFKPTHDLLAQESEFETWSQICLKALFSGHSAKSV